jgi:nucleoside-diphosphate-sugar epimerase
VLVHLAAHSVQYPFDSLANCLRWNLMAVLELFEQARNAGIERFIVAGSCFEYGRSGERHGAIPTDAPLEPTNSYAASKASASIALCQWAEEHHLSLEILRVFHIYGEGEQETRFWPSLKRAALEGEDFPMTKGEQIRDFLSVQYAALIFLKRAVLPPSSSPGVNIFNLGSGNSISLMRFAERFWAELGAKGDLKIGTLPYRDREVMRFSPGPELLTPF